MFSIDYISFSLSRASSRYNIEAFGLDYVSSSLLAQKRNSPCNLHLCNGDAEFLPYKNDSFDIVVAISVIEHLSDYSTAFSEIRRVLKHQGSLLLQVPCKDFRFSLFARFRTYESLKHKEWFLRNQKSCITGFRFHDLRRVAGSQMARRGVPESVVKYLGGWRTDIFFRRYRHIDPSELNWAVNGKPANDQVSTQVSTSVYKSVVNCG